MFHLLRDSFQRRLEERSRRTFLDLLDSSCLCDPAGGGAPLSPGQGRVFEAQFGVLNGRAYICLVIRMTRRPMASWAPLGVNEMRESRRGL